MLNRLDVRLSLFVLLTSTVVLLTSAVVLLPFVAFAQVAADAPLALPADPTDIHAMAQLVLTAVMSKQWGLLASLLVLVTVASLRKYVPESTKVGAWFRTKLGGVLTAFTLSVAGAFATLFLAGAPFSGALVLKALSIALGASGGWSAWKNIREALDERKAQSAGTDAAKSPSDTLNQ